VWNETHQVGGKLFMIMAFVMLITLFFPEKFLVLFITPLAAVVIFIMAYSYVLYRRYGKKKK